MVLKGSGKGGGGLRGSRLERVGYKRASPARLSASEGRANKNARFYQQFWFTICLFLFLFLGLNVLTVVPPTVQVSAGTVRLLPEAGAQQRKPFVEDTQLMMLDILCQCCLLLDSNQKSEKPPGDDDDNDGFRFDEEADQQPADPSFRARPPVDQAP